MKRREFVTLVGGAAVTAWPLAARAQQGRLVTIGYLGAATPSRDSHWAAAFEKRLRELGWIDGRAAIEYRWGEGRNERFAELAADLIRRKVDVIVTNGTGATLAAKRATSTTPIVFAAAGDPVGTGLVNSLARPGGNVTGLSVQAADLAGKRLEILREVVPGLRRLAVMGNGGNPNTALQMGEVEEAARAFGLEVVPAEIRRGEDVEPALAALKGRADALYVFGDPLMSANQIRINKSARGARLPTIYNYREFVVAGGLMSYGPDFTDLFRRAAELVDKILRGTKPADIPVQQPIRFELVVNLITAKGLGLRIPKAVLVRANEVIE